MLCIDAQTTQSCAVASPQPFMPTPCWLKTPFVLIGVLLHSWTLVEITQLDCRSHIEHYSLLHLISHSYFPHPPNDCKYLQYGVPRLTKPIFNHILTCYGDPCQHD